MSSAEDDYDFGPQPGLPAALPEGERVIWRGSPDPMKLTIRAFRMPLVVAYFAMLAGWQLASSVEGGATVAEIFDRVTWTAGLGIATLAILGGLGWAIAKNSFYTVTNKRVIVRHGVAMPMAINIPFTKIDAAELRTFADGSADIPVTLAAGNSVPRLLIWPHTRPLSYLRTQPTLRAVPDGARVAGLIATAMRDAQLPHHELTGAERPEQIAIAAANTGRVKPSHSNSAHTSSIGPLSTSVGAA